MPYYNISPEETQLYILGTHVYTEEHTHTYTCTHTSGAELKLGWNEVVCIIGKSPRLGILPSWL